MHDNQVSTTSLITAFIRAYHSTFDEPKIFDDFLAREILTKEQYRELRDRLAMRLRSIDSVLADSHPDQKAALASVLRSMGAPTILSRARYAEDYLEKAVSQGVRQYVILGAGMDTFAFRKPKLVERLRVFEVDHPATQGYKRRRIAELRWETPPQLQYVEVDFTREDLGTVLRCSSYDPSQLTFFSWLGVTMYLDREVVLRTLQDIASITPAGSLVFFDYFHADAFSKEKGSVRMLRSQESVARLGEPMKSGFEPSELAAELAGMGMRLDCNLNPYEIEARYFPGRYGGYSGVSQAHFARVVIERPGKNKTGGDD